MVRYCCARWRVVNYTTSSRELRPAHLSETERIRDSTCARTLQFSPGNSAAWTLDRWVAAGCVNDMKSKTRCLVRLKETGLPCTTD